MVVLVPTATCERFPDLVMKHNVEVLEAGIALTSPTYSANTRLLIVRMRSLALGALIIPRKVLFNSCPEAPTLLVMEVCYVAHGLREVEDLEDVPGARAMLLEMLSGDLMKRCTGARRAD